jgi:hypothetical protein
LKRITELSLKELEKIAEIIENAEKIELNSCMLAALEINVADLRDWLFSAFAGNQGCWIGPENRNWTLMLSAVANKTVKLCVCAAAWKEVSMSTVNHSFLSNCWPHSSPFQFSRLIRHA